MNKLTELTNRHIKLAETDELLVVREIVKKYSEEEVFRIIKRSFEKFLLSIMHDNVYEVSFSDIERWKQDRLPWIGRKNFYLTDLVYLYNTRKTLFTLYIPEFTKDIEEGIDLILQIDEIQSKLQQKMLQAFFEVQVEEQAKNQLRLKALANASFEGILFHKEGIIEDTNHSICKIFGCSDPKKLIGSTITSFITEDSKDGIEENLKKETIKPFVCNIKKPDGAIAMVEIRSKKLESATEGQRVVAIRDISEIEETRKLLEVHQRELEKTNQKLLEQIEIKSAIETDLRNSELNFRLLAEFSSDIISVHNAEGFFTYVSPSAKKILGYLPSELIGKSPYKYINTKDIPVVRDIHDLLLIAESEQTITYRFRKKDGTFIWLESRGIGVKNNKGGIKEIHINSRDVTDRKEVEAKLEQEHSYTNAILETINEAIIACDHEGKISYLNRSAIAFFGKRENGGTVDTWQTHFPLYNPTDKTLLEKEKIPIIKAFKGEIVKDFEAVILTGQSTRHILNSGRPIITPDGKFLGAVVIMLDISERKISEKVLKEKNEALLKAFEELKTAEETLINVNNELEERVVERTIELSEINKELKKEISERRLAEKSLKEKNQELLRSNNDLDNFVYTASHDLKAPISNLEALVSELKPELKILEDQGAKQLLSFVETSVMRLKRTIEELTEINKIQRNIEDDIVEIDVAAVFKEVFLLNKELVDKINAEVITDFTKGGLLCFSRKNFQSILFHLLNNALKYHSKDRRPKVFIRTNTRRKFFILSVQDNGIGIPERFREKIFRMFKRLHDHVEGSGVGLYIVKRIVDNAGGKIKLTSVENKETCFQILLPQSQ